MTGVLVMAHGTPAAQADVPDFYTSIRRGRPPTDQQLADLLRRYDAIGGLSPLAERTAAQVAGIAAALGPDFDVRYGAKHTAPSIETAATALEHHDRVIGLVLTPHYSSMGSGEYLERAAAVLGPTLVPVQHWYDAPGFAGLVAARVNDALATLRTTPVTVVFTAHSLPERARHPYVEQVEASATLVAAAAGLAAHQVAHRVAWQSGGRTPDPWIGPDLATTLAGIDAGAVVICPIGFVADHLEVLYDVDIDARRMAAEHGLEFARTASLNEDVCRLLAGVVRARA